MRCSQAHGTSNMKGMTYDAYVQKFCDLLARAPNFDLHSLWGFFIYGLLPDYQYEVRKSHPKTIDKAIKAAKIFDEMVANNMKTISKNTSSTFIEQGSKGKRKFTPKGIVQSKKETNPHKPFSKRFQNSKEGQCFSCIQKGHTQKVLPKGKEGWQ